MNLPDPANGRFWEFGLQADHFDGKKLYDLLDDFGWLNPLTSGTPPTLTSEVDPGQRVGSGRCVG